MHGAINMYSAANPTSSLSILLQQATIDFTTASTNTAQSGAVLVDTSAILLHGEDVGSSVCVLAVEGYGEGYSKPTVEKDPVASNATSPFAAVAAEMENDQPAIVRGPRDWRETVGGGSICCSQCCSILGFASLNSPETYRFLKHRLVFQDKPEETHDKTMSSSDDAGFCETSEFSPLTSCACFVAHEMIRYAETKAIFTFVVEQTETGDNERHFLLLKLLSWGSQIATSKETQFLEIDGNDSHLIQDVCFKKTAKIIFEETTVGVGNSEDREIQPHNDTDDISNWIWGGADLCCLPDAMAAKTHPVDNSVSKNNGPGSESAIELLGQAQQSTSSVRLLLESGEYDELRAALQEGAKFFSKQVSDATVAAKLGRRNIPHRKGSDLKLGLSAISLEGKNTIA